MGLSIYPGEAEWSYGGFSRFRERLATLEGIDLRTMAGFTANGKPWADASGYPVTPLVPLLNHSDCDGYLDSYECRRMLPRLRVIAADERSFNDEYYNREQLRKLIAGMEHSVEHGCAVVFS